MRLKFLWDLDDTARQNEWSFSCGDCKHNICSSRTEPHVPPRPIVPLPSCFVLCHQLWAKWPDVDAQKWHDNIVRSENADTGQGPWRHRYCFTQLVGGNDWDVLLLCESMYFQGKLRFFCRKQLLYYNVCEKDN